MSWLIVLMALALGAGFWAIWRSGLIGSEALPGPVASLQQHFQSVGLDTTAKVVRNPQLNEVRKHVRFALRGADDQPFYVYWCQGPVEAQRVLERYRKAPGQNVSAARGSLLVYMSGWSPDEARTQKVLQAFNSWPADTAKP
jgi:hypothetical protein